MSENEKPLSIWRLVCIGLWFGFGFTAGATLFTTAIPMVISKAISFIK